MKRLGLFLILLLSGCASSGAGQGDLMGRPRIRTVSTPVTAPADGGLMPGSTTIQYVEDPVIVRDLVQAPADAAWSHLLDAYREEGLVPDLIDPERRLVSLSRFVWSRDRNGLPLSTYLECGSSTNGMPVADRAQIVASIVSQVGEEGATTVAVSTRLEAYALPFEAGGGRAQDCATTGRLEEEIVARISDAVGEPSLNRSGFSPSPGPVAVGSEGGVSGGLPEYEHFFPGDKIRVQLSPTDRFTGTFLGFRSGSLLLKRSRVNSYPLPWIQGVEVREPRKAAIWAGALVGIAAGVTLATTTSLGITGSHEVQGEILNPGLGAVVGGLLGGFLGSSIFGTSWIRVPLESLGGG